MIFQEKFELVTALMPLQYIVPDCDSHLRYSGFAEYTKPSFCMACPWPNSTMLLSPLGFLGIICLPSDFWLCHLGCKATPEKNWCLSDYAGKPAVVAEQVIAQIKPLSCWLYPGWLLFVCERWQIPAGDEQCLGQAPSAADGCLADSQAWWFALSLRRCKFVTSLKVIEKFWCHHKKVEATTLYFVPEVSGEFGLPQKPWDLQAWNETQLPCGVFFF